MHSMRTETPKARKPVESPALCRDARGRVLKGFSLGGTRKGSPNRSTLAGKELLAYLERGDAALGLLPVAERWVALLKDPDPAIRAGCEKFLHEALHGRSRQEIDGGSDTTIRIVNASWNVGPRCTETHESK